MTVLPTVVLVATLSGFPLGNVLCGVACTPEPTQTTPACHEHGTDTGAGPVVTGIHLCNQDASVVPVIAQPVFALASGGTDVPYEALSIGAMHLAPPAPVGVFPSGPQRS